VLSVVGRHIRIVSTWRSKDVFVIYLLLNFSLHSGVGGALHWLNRHCIPACNLWPPWFCFSAGKRWLSLSDESPWCNDSQCRFFNNISQYL